MKIRHLCAAALLAAASSFVSAAPVPESFTYQGVLEVDGDLVQTDADFIIRLYHGGGLAESVSRLGVPVNNGRFVLDLGFDPANFDGTDYEIEFLVRSPAGIGSYETLGDRQPLTTVPYAYHANTADELLVPSVVESGAPGILLTLNQTDTFIGDSALRVTWDSVVSIFGTFLDRVMEVESDTAPIGILSRASQFPFAGILDGTTSSVNNAAVLGEVQGDAPEYARAIWALNAQSGNKAELGTGTHAGKFTGDVQVSGDITKQYSFASYDLAAPIAYGFVSSSGTITAGTPNFSCVWNASFSRYEIEIDNESYFFNAYVTIATPSTPTARITLGSVSGRLLVYLRNASTGALEQGNFQFVTYKPGGAAAVAGFPRRQIQPLNSGAADDQFSTRNNVALPRTPVIEEETTESPLIDSRE